MITTDPMKENTATLIANMETNVFVFQSGNLFISDKSNTDAGDEGIEPPTSVLETEVIPFN